MAVSKMRIGQTSEVFREELGEGEEGRVGKECQG